jgi:hypothetical protein
MPVNANAGKTVAEILATKKASVKNAPLEEGSPSWDEIMDVRWEEIVGRAKQRLAGYKTIKKLLSSREYDK